MKNDSTAIPAHAASSAADPMPYESCPSSALRVARISVAMTSATIA